METSKDWRTSPRPDAPLYRLATYKGRSRKRQPLGAKLRTHVEYPSEKEIEKAAGHSPFAEVPAALVNLTITSADPSRDLKEVDRGGTLKVYPYTKD